MEILQNLASHQQSITALYIAMNRHCDIKESDEYHVLLQQLYEATLRLVGLRASGL